MDTCNYTDNPSPYGTYPGVRKSAKDILHPEKSL